MEIKDYITGIQHVGIPTNDIEETIRFYEKLGFEPVYRTVNGTEKVAFLQLHNLVIETYQNGCATLKSGAIDHIALDVKNIDKVFELAKGLEVEFADTKVMGLPFWKNGVKFFTILGPNKERVEFCEKL